VASGEELLNDFGEHYWQTQRKLHGDVKRLSKLCDHDYHRRLPTISASIYDSCFLLAAWLKGLWEGANVRAMVQRGLRREAARSTALKRTS
jgi:hypothetical protein